MIMIILHHLTVHCILPQLTDETLITLFDNGFYSEPAYFRRLLVPESLMPMGKTADAIFLLISGYFMVERGNAVRLTRPIKKILTQMLFAVVVLIFGSALYYAIRSDRFVALQGIELFNGGWWFTGYYLAVIIVGAIWLNAFLLRLDRETYRTWLIVFFAVFSLGWIGSILEGFATGFRTLAAGLWLYALGGYIKKYDPFGRIRLWVLIAGFLGVYALVWLSYHNASIDSIQQYFRSMVTMDEKELADLDPFVQVKRYYPDYSIVPITLGVILFEITRRVRIPHSRVINWLGSASFMVYLIHDNDFMRNLWKEQDVIILLYERPAQFCLFLLKWVVLVYLAGCIGYFCYQLFLKLLGICRNNPLFVSASRDRTSAV